MNNWYAVYTQPRWEVKVANSLTKNKVENYCPLNKIIHQENDRSKIIRVPLFDSYVFVKTNENELCYLKKVKGIINVVYWLEKPAVIKNAEIEIIKSFLSEHTNIELRKTEVNRNEREEINEPLIKEKDNSILSENKVKLVLPSLGYTLVAEGDKSNIILIKSSNHHKVVK